MALWPVASPPWPTANFSVIDPTDVLIEHGEPLTFAFLDVLGNQMLAHMCATDQQLNRYVVVPTDDEILGNLKSGSISIRDALGQPLLWLIDADNSGKVTACWSQKLTDLPAGAVPASGVLLYRHLSGEYKTNRFVQSQADGQIAFDGAPVADHEINVGFYATFLGRFQSLYESACTVMHQQTFGELRIGLGMASSYAVDVRVPVDGQAAGDMFGGEGSESIRPRAAFDLVAAMIIGDNDPSTIEVINLNQDLRRQYGGILELMSQTGARILVRTRDFPHGRELTNYDAGLRFRAVRELGFPFGNLSVRGRLIGGLTEKVNKDPVEFTLKINEALSYKGGVAELALEKMKTLQFASLVIAKIRVNDSDGKHQTYELLDLEQVKGSIVDINESKANG